MIKLLPLAGLVALLAVTPLLAAPRTIDDCEKIQAADAYNQCLASFGPVAKEHNLSPVGAGKAPPADAKANAMSGDDVVVGPTKPVGKGRAARGRTRRGATGRHGGGRKSMSFTVRRSHRR